MLRDGLFRGRLSIGMVLGRGRVAPIPSSSAAAAAGADAHGELQLGVILLYKVDDFLLELDLEVLDKIPALDLDRPAGAVRLGQILLELGREPLRRVLINSHCY
jgi:hypothetical protein